MTKPQARYQLARQRHWTFVSWGAGVQSTCMLAMSALGDLPPIDMALFADLGWERQVTYDIINWYTPWLAERGVKVEILKTGDIRKDGATEHIHIPFWTSNGGPLQRQCTAHFKIEPIRRRMRELAGFPPSHSPAPAPGQINLWLGISLDEYTRMTTSEVTYVKNTYPLIDQRVTRTDCIDYLKAHGLPVPVKSACVGCPYRAASEWQQMKDQAPTEFAEAIAFDETNRNNPFATRGDPTKDQLYIWKTAIPLQAVNLEAEAAKERTHKQIPMFIPCEGGYCHS